MLINLLITAFSEKGGTPSLIKILESAVKILIIFNERKYYEKH